MNKLLQAPRGCPTYGKEHWSHQAGAIWDLGKRQHFPAPSRTLSPCSPSTLSCWHHQLGLSHEGPLGFAWV